MVRGLSIRLDYAKAMVSQQIGVGDEDKQSEVMFILLNDAYKQGWHDHKAGFTECPELFNDTPFLWTHWHEGWALSTMQQEIMKCSGCRTSEGIPCSRHG